MKKYQQIYKQLQEDIPEIFQLLNADDYFYNDEVLITILLADLSGIFRSAVKQGNTAMIENINLFLEKLLMQNDSDIENVIITGFLESFDPDNSNYEGYKSMLSTKLKIAIEHLDEVLALKKKAPQNWFE